MGDDFYTLEQLRLEDSASEYSSEGEDASHSIMGELAEALQAQESASKTHAKPPPTTSKTLAKDDQGEAHGTQSTQATNRGAASNNKQHSANQQTKDHPLDGKDEEQQQKQQPDEEENQELDEEMELHDDEEDERNKHFVKKHFRDKNVARSDALLSCPGCFSTVAYDTTQHPRVKTWYTSKRAFNCNVRETNAREADIDAENVLECAECSTALGVQREDHVFEFRTALPSAVE
ncbi:E2F-associated phosphoprotein [Hondaea fermentalgiana]|uniref:E2F-associated phosphoprotein n=1 Tax=Hondaea fermentalgiana TaxID=2315210 RepID=A0A2R5GPM8_9STRA|nr:E2F-associated phosphoprotein [Hondaea fermentalgiana]|eukprot:GBG30291.1 E2F-associated phosphoprotein [Hondaea fermentalgiana]